MISLVPNRSEAHAFRPLGARTFFKGNPSLVALNRFANLRNDCAPRDSGQCSGRTSLWWLLVPITMIGCGVSSSKLPWFPAKEVEIPTPFRIRLVGEKKLWSATLPELFDSSHTIAVPVVSLTTGEAIHVPAGIDLQWELTSVDYVYTFTIVEKRIKEIAVPTLTLEMPVAAQPVGRMTMVSEPLCGDPHRYETISIVVDSRDDFLAWLRLKSRDHHNES